jgi:hypothetical protein
MMMVLSKTIIMKKIYPLLLVFLTACSKVKIIYVGNEAKPVSHLDVFIDETLINRPYEVMGLAKGNITAPWLGKDYDEEIAKKAIERAKKCGADAILFSNYYNKLYTPENRQESKVVYTDTSITRTASQKTIPSPMSTGRQILFLKYK